MFCLRISSREIRNTTGSATAGNHEEERTVRKSGLLGQRQLDRIQVQEKAGKPL